MQAGSRLLPLSTDPKKRLVIMQQDHAANMQVTHGCSIYWMCPDSMLGALRPLFCGLVEAQWSTASNQAGTALYSAQLHIDHADGLLNATGEDVISRMPELQQD